MDGRKEAWKMGENGDPRYVGSFRRLAGCLRPWILHLLLLQRRIIYRKMLACLLPCCTMEVSRTYHSNRLQIFFLPICMHERERIVVSGGWLISYLVWITFLISLSSL